MSRGSHGLNATVRTNACMSASGTTTIATSWISFATFAL